MEKKPHHLSRYDVRYITEKQPGGGKGGWLWREGLRRPKVPEEADLELAFGRIALCFKWIYKNLFIYDGDLCSRV